jgi:cell division protease FtsH
MKNFKSKNMLLGVLAFLAAFFVLSLLTDFAQKTKTFSYLPTFVNALESGQVESVQIVGQEILGELKDKTSFHTTVGNDPALWKNLRDANVEVNVTNVATQASMWYFLMFILIATLILSAVWYFVKQARGGGNGGNGGGPNIFSMGKSKARMYMPSEIKVKFDSVAGATEAKEELKDVVDFLKNPEKFKRLGAKITRGVLLVGEPGNGKTLLAKAVAGEANCPFLSISGSDFIEVFVGVGASRVRDLFAQARKNSPSIIFIDEIDAVGRQRGSGLGGGHDEREQTLNQLLTEMDGFQTEEGSVIVMAATNRPDVLDKALLRPGRFDRRVEVPYPDLNSRLKILELHAKNVKIDPEVNMEKIARGTPGFTGADLANLINEAALNASKTEQTSVLVKDFEEARDKITMGKELKTIILSPEERKVTAFHEAGHALVRLMMPNDTDPLHKITIIPRGRALGVTHFLPEKERHSKSEEDMVAELMALHGGRVAEEMIFNKKMTGASSDFQRATEIARAMVCYYGMSDAVGPVVYGQGQQDFSYSQKTAEEIDKAVKDLLLRSYHDAQKLLTDNRDKLTLLAETLLEKETLYAGEVYELLGITPRTELKFGE